MTVKELINELLNYPMDTEVYIHRYGKFEKVNEDSLKIDKEYDLVIDP